MARDTFPRFNRQRRECMAFARFCAEHKLDPFDLAHLMTLADKAFKAGERECNVKNYDAHAYRMRFEMKARAMGFETYWPGLLPALRLKTRTIHLPEC